jgi:hypothetical protein
MASTSTVWITARATFRAYSPAIHLGIEADPACDHNPHVERFLVLMVAENTVATRNL